MKKIITVNSAHYTSLWRQIDPRLNPRDYNLESTMAVVEIIEDLLTSSINRYPNVSEVIILSELEGQANTTGTPTVNFENFGIKPALYFAPDAPYNNLLQVLKQMLLSFGCMGYTGIDGKFYITPRAKNSTAPVQLLQKDYAETPRAKVIPPMKGLQVEVGTGLYWQGWGLDGQRIYAQYQIGDTTDSSKVERLKFEVAGGSWPETFASVNPPIDYLRLWHNGSWHDAVENSFRRKKEDGNYTDRTALWQLITNDYWNLINKSRMSVQVEMSGDYTKYGFGNDYSLQDYPGKIFRLRKPKYNLIKKRAELDLIECTTAPTATSGNIVFTKILRAIEARLIDGLTSGSPEYSGEGNDVQVSGVNLRLRSKNAYGCGLLEATEYDGSVITIPADKTDVWYFNYNHVFYIFAFDIDNPNGPTTRYPIADDPNGKWYFLRSLSDQQIIDPDFKYEYRLAKIDMPNRFSFFVGLQPEGVPLFPGIRVLNK